MAIQRVTDPKLLKPISYEGGVPQYHIVYRDINSFSSEGASNIVFTHTDPQTVLNRLHALNNSNKNPNKEYAVINDYGDMIPEQLLKKQI
jgi:hypothetical protein